MQGQVAANLLGAGGAACFGAGCSGSGFWGYTDRTAFSAVSFGGDVHYENDPWASVDSTQALGTLPAFKVSMTGSGSNSLNTAFGRAPPIFEVASLQSSVYLEDHFATTNDTLTLASAPLGNLELLAGQDVHLALNTQMEDVASNQSPGPLAAFALQGDVAPVVIIPAFVSASGTAPLHASESRSRPHLRGQRLGVRSAFGGVLPRHDRGGLGAGAEATRGRGRSGRGVGEVPAREQRGERHLGHRGGARPRPGRGERDGGGDGPAPGGTQRRFWCSRRRGRALRRRMPLRRVGWSTASAIRRPR